jgi:hypothetical protein
MKGLYSKISSKRLFPWIWISLPFDLAHSLFDVIFKMNLCALKIER